MRLHLGPQPAVEVDHPVLQGLLVRAGVVEALTPEGLAALVDAFDDEAVLTGALVGVVLVVMTGGTALTFQDLGWLPATPLPFAMPGWLGSWFEIYGTYEGIACQLAAVLLVVGSYVLAEHLKVRRPARKGGGVARRAEAPPAPGA